jgi:hypothetical protein
MAPLTPTLVSPALVAREQTREKVFWLTTAARLGFRPQSFLRLVPLGIRDNPKGLIQVRYPFGLRALDSQAFARVRIFAPFALIPNHFAAISRIAKGLAAAK